MKRYVSNRMTTRTKHVLRFQVPGRHDLLLNRWKKNVALKSLHLQEFIPGMKFCKGDGSGRMDS